MTHILFVCSANRFRSVIAEATLKSLAEKDPRLENFEVSSAGTWATDGLAPLPQALRVANKLGLEIEGIQSREVNKEILENASMLIVMTESQREALILEFQQDKQKIHLISEVFAGETYDIPDLYEKVDETPEAIGNEIHALIVSGYPQFVDFVKTLRNR